ncbi:MAG TPA: amidohydrolase family protein [Acidimicrobiales bacterium]
MAEHDLVIRGGEVVDGTGAPPRRADVAISGGRIQAVGTGVGAGRDEIDATDLTVTPGWVDVHTHYDGQVTWDPILAPSSWHGVTTAVMGNCGVGFAPVRPDKHAWLIELMEGVEDIPGTALHEGITWGWESFPEYLDVIERMPRTIDIGAQVPHGALRGYVMGDRGADHTEVPTVDEIAEMGRLAAEAIRAGALGFTTSRSVAHKSADGRHTPTLTATADELLGIARAIGETGAGVFEVVADLVDLERELALLRAMAECSARPMSITTLQRPGFPPDEYRRILGLIENAVADGVELRGQVAARPVGLIMSLDGRVHPLLGAPTYHKLEHLPIEERVVELRRPEVRDAILAELAALPPGTSPLERFPHVFVLDDPPRYDRDASESLAAIAARRATTPVAIAYDALVADDRGGMLYVPVTNFVEADLRAVREMLVHPLTVPGLGDAGAHCTMICDGSFPTYLLSFWGIDAPEPDRLPIEWIVKRQCADTAALVGLHDRGVLAPGYRADVNVIDLGALAIGKPEMVHDLPAGGKRLVQRASGYVATVVGGQVTFRDGTHTGAMPGKLVRGAQPAPTT